MRAIVVFGLTAILGLTSCGEQEKKKETMRMIKPNIDLSKVDKQAKKDVEKAISFTQEKVDNLNEELENAERTLSEDIKAVEEAIEELDNEFKD